MRFGGLPVGALHMEGETTGAVSFAEVVLRIKNYVGDEAANVHWRYAFLFANPVFCFTLRFS